MWMWVIFITLSSSTKQTMSVKHKLQVRLVVSLSNSVPTFIMKQFCSFHLGIYLLWENTFQPYQSTYLIIDSLFVFFP